MKIEIKTPEKKIKEIQTAHVVPAKKREFVEVLTAFNMEDDKDYRISVEAEKDLLRIDLKKMDSKLYDIFKNIIRMDSVLNDATTFG